MKRIIYFILLLFVSITAHAEQQSYTPQSVPLLAGDKAEYVIDPAHLLSPTTVSQLDNDLQQIRNTSTCGMAVAILPAIDSPDINAFSTELLNRMKLGTDDKDNGVLFVVAVEQRQAFIATGYGMEGVLPDAICASIVRQDFVPAMKQGNLDAGVLNVVQNINMIIGDPAHLEELKSREGYAGTLEPESVDSTEFWNAIYGICSVVFLISLGFFIADCIACRKKSQYEKAMLWRSHIEIYIAGTIFTLGAGLIILLLALWKMYRSRNKRIRCDTCGAKMKKLSEEEDNSMLSPSQDLEEKLDTVDYDVWVCPDCGTVERFPFKKKQLKYTECPSCHTIALHEVCDITVQPATTRSAGIGEKVYKCKYCGFDHRKRYKIPRKENMAGPLVAGAVLGSMSRGGGGGGGYSGPSGGGMSGGGGGGASW